MYQYLAKKPIARLFLFFVGCGSGGWWLWGGGGGGVKQKGGIVDLVNHCK